MKKTITVTISPDGTTEVSADGFKGKGCEAATKFVEEALGIAGAKKTKRPEWYQQETVAQKQTT